MAFFSLLLAGLLLSISGITRIMTALVAAGSYVSGSLLPGQIVNLSCRSQAKVTDS